MLSGRKPPWLKVRLPSGENYRFIRQLLHREGLHTVCEEANCPNIGECYNQLTATFLILGDICTRRCRFCNIKGGSPSPPDPQEPEKIAKIVKLTGLKHVVITSVTRDDLEDGGAQVFVDTIHAIRRKNKNSTIEVLIPDFRKSLRALDKVINARPEIINHNVETVPRLYKTVRPGASYDYSLRILKRVKELSPRILTKSGLIVGLGEGKNEILEVMDDLREHRCEILTIGQYLSPGKKHLPVKRFYHPEEFEELRREALKRGFIHVESGPLVRSSYHAAIQAIEAGISLTE